MCFVEIHYIYVCRYLFTSVFECKLNEALQLKDEPPYCKF